MPAGILKPLKGALKLFVGSVYCRTELHLGAPTENKTLDFCLRAMSVKNKNLNKLNVYQHSECYSTSSCRCMERRGAATFYNGGETESTPAAGTVRTASRQIWTNGSLKAPQWPGNNTFQDRVLFNNSRRRRSAPDGFEHAQAHLHTAVGVVRSGLR